MYIIASEPFNREPVSILALERNGTKKKKKKGKEQTQEQEMNKVIGRAHCPYKPVAIFLVTNFLSL